MIKISLILLKLADNLISSCKSLNLHDLNAKRVFLFSLLKALLFFYVIKSVSTNSNTIIILASIAGALGSAIPVYFKSKNKKNIEEVWQFDIVCQSRSQSKKLADDFRKMRIEILTSELYNDKIDRVLCVSAISNNSRESKSIISNIPSGCRVRIQKDIESFIKR